MTLKLVLNIYNYQFRNQDSFQVMNFMSKYSLLNLLALIINDKMRKKEENTILNSKIS